MSAGAPPAPTRRWGWRAPSEAAVVSPLAAVAHGGASRRLLGVLAASSSSRREGWRLTATQDWLIVLGDSAALHWVEGARYAAPAACAPMLWLPTHAALDVDAGLVLRALQRRHARSPLLLWPSPELVLPLDLARPADDATLTLLARRWQVRLSIAAGLARTESEPISEAASEAISEAVSEAVSKNGMPS
jgi:hypothetical protein